jgi:hypothetical protein
MFAVGREGQVVNRTGVTREVTVKAPPRGLPEQNPIVISPRGEEEAVGRVADHRGDLAMLAKGRSQTSQGTSRKLPGLGRRGLPGNGFDFGSSDGLGFLHR